MRKTSYVVAFIAVAITLLMNVLSAQRQDWLVTKVTVLGSSVTVRYGFLRRCESTVFRIPEGGGKYTGYQCRAFPKRVEDDCEDEHRGFCAAWTTAGYVTELAIGFGATALLAIIFGLSTHSRRRRIWKVVAWLVGFHALFQIVAFAIVTHVYSQDVYPAFDRARPASSYVFNTVAWIFGVLITFGLVATGMSATAGHRWAAGNRAYHPIEG